MLIDDPSIQFPMDWLLRKTTQIFSGCYAYQAGGTGDLPSVCRSNPCAHIPDHVPYIHNSSAAAGPPNRTFPDPWASSGDYSARNRQTFSSWVSSACTVQVSLLCFQVFHCTLLIFLPLESFSMEAHLVSQGFKCDSSVGGSPFLWLWAGPRALDQVAGLPVFHSGESYAQMAGFHLQDHLQEGKLASLKFLLLLFKNLYTFPQRSLLTVRTCTRNVVTTSGCETKNFTLMQISTAVVNMLVNARNAKMLQRL